MSDPSLREFQQWMKTRIRAPHPAPAPSGLASPVTAQGGVSGSDRVDEVYAGGYMTRVREALAEVYETVQYVFGERRFAEMAEAYAAAHPSHDYNLSFVGRHLPEWLDRSALSRELPFAGDLARLEWLVCQAFHAFDEPPAQLAAFAALPMEAWERVRFEFQPSMGLIESAWPICDIWAARKQPRRSINIEVAGRPQRVLVSRRGVDVSCDVVEADAFVLLQRLAAGQTLGAACAAIAQSAHQGPPLERWFTRWAGQGIIRRIAGA